MDDLRNKLLSDNNTLRDAIDALRQEDRVVEVLTNSYYLPVSTIENDQGQQLVRNFDVVAASLDVIDRFLGGELHLPFEVVRQYFNAGLQELLNEEFIRSEAYVRGGTYYVYFKRSALGRLRQIREGVRWGDFWHGYLDDKTRKALGNEILDNFLCFPTRESFDDMPEVVGIGIWNLQSKV